MSEFVYLIWAKPWMAAGPSTFIGDVLGWLGYGSLHRRSDAPYPKVAMAELNPANTALLLSSEPYPFARAEAQMRALGFPCALVDGEKFSWFGVRTLTFLEEQPDDRPR